MQTIITYAAENWPLIICGISLLIIAFCQGGFGPMKRHIRDLEEHRGWLQSWGEGWRDIALGAAIDREDLSDDLIADLKRVAARVKAEREKKKEKK